MRKSVVALFSCLVMALCPAAAVFAASPKTGVYETPINPIVIILIIVAVIAIIACLFLFRKKK